MITTDHWRDALRERECELAASYQDRLLREADADFFGDDDCEEEL